MLNSVRHFSALIVIIFYYEGASLTAVIRRAVPLLSRVRVKKWGHFNGVIWRSLTCILFYQSKVYHLNLSKLEAFSIWTWLFQCPRHVRRNSEKLSAQIFYLSESYKSNIFVNYYVSAITENFFHLIWIQIDCYSVVRSWGNRKRDNTLSLACYWVGL